MSVSESPKAIMDLKDEDEDEDEEACLVFDDKMKRKKYESVILIRILGEKHKHVTAIGVHVCEISFLICTY